ncbi:MAG TPA: nitroreductase family protein [Saprospiraceae bacterium]|nr:nitroreductase family protein [Saprospiraceae bacterium]MCB9328026.1 nitroreductase family protein [Lewinellaceae bacterium]HPQ20362.1 nitroreductase family protein [Saprospiraceae bacterium]
MKEGFKKYQYKELEDSAILQNSITYRNNLENRRSIRFFSDKPVDKQVIENIIMSASSAPSGANKQPWTFCAISNPEFKAKIRKAAEIEEYENYHGRMGEEWLRDLEKFDTDWHKPFLETAPWLIVVFKSAYDVDSEGVKHKNYYVNESVGIACGFLISAIHQVGLVTLTHTPSPMNFLHEILGRPENERAYLLLPVGHPSDDAEVPILEKKTSDQVIKYFE